MRITELYDILNKKIPRELSCPWDNDGLMCCPDGDREVKNVLITLDVTGDCIKYAKENGYDLIISHHPFIFKGLRAINGDSHTALGAMELIKGDISVMSFHTRLDAVEGGVNDTLCSILGLSKIIPFGEEEIGRIGELPEKMSLSEFSQKVKDILGAPALLVADGKREVKHVAVLGGEGGDDIAAARAMEVDTYLSGRLGYHNMTDAPEKRINLIEAGHFYTEFPVCFTLEKMLKEIDPNIRGEIYFSNRIMYV